LGSSLFSAQLAAALGLPFSFASHFAPDHLQEALQLYRSRFQPSDQLDRPYVMPGVNVFAAATDAEARRHFTSLQQAFVKLRRGAPGPLPPPVDSMDGLWSPMEQAGVEHAFRYAIVGSPETVRRGLAAFIAETEADEIMVTAQMFDHAARLRSFELVASVRDALAASAPSAACA
jgi:luciferase family oxidoreductase group 1